MAQSDTIRNQRVQKLAELRAQGVEPFANGFVPTHTTAQILGEFGALGGPELAALNQTFRLAGRLMLLREFGKATFCHFQDGTSRVQAYVQRQVLGPEAFALFKRLDLGDIVGFTGTLFRTKTGELTLAVTDFVLLTKSLLPLPEKYHGLTDVETRYRQRYLDLMVNPQVREVFVKRAAIISLMRQFFEARGFLEVETPMMQPIPGGATARPFVTYHQALDMTLYLRIAPELYLKRLVIGGFDRVFEINRNFRNEGLSIQHNPEFTMLEFYQAYATYEDLMLLTEELICHVAREILGTLRFACQGAEIDLTPPWARLDLRESLTSIGGIPAEVVRDREALVALALAEGVNLRSGEGYGRALTKLFDLKVEARLVQPTFILGYPRETSPLSRGSERRVLVVSESLYSRPGPRSAEAVEELARFLHPEVFGEKK